MEFEWEKGYIKSRAFCMCVCVYAIAQLRAFPIQHSPSTFQFLLFCVRLIFNYFYFLYTCRPAYSELREAWEQYHIYMLPMEAPFVCMRAKLLLVDGHGARSGGMARQYSCWGADTQTEAHWILRMRNVVIFSWVANCNLCVFCVFRGKN